MHKTTRILLPLAMSLTMGVSLAAAQTQATGDDAQKNKSVRQIGASGWPAAKSADERQADQRKTARSKKIDAGETTGSATSKADRDPLAIKSSAEKPDPGKSGSQPEAKPAEKTQSEPQELGINKENAAKAAAPAGSVKTSPEAVEAKPAKADPASEAKTSGAASIRLGTNAEGRVAVNDAQQRQVASAVRKLNVRPATNINIEIRAGVVVPRTVRLTAVSAEFVDVLPQFRGYSFFTTYEEIVIVEPGTMKIVALIPTGGPATASRPARATTAASATVRRSTTGSASREMTIGERRPVIIERTITYPRGPVVIERRGPRIIWEDD